MVINVVCCRWPPCEVCVLICFSLEFSEKKWISTKTFPLLCYRHYCATTASSFPSSWVYLSRLFPTPPSPKHPPCDILSSSRFLIGSGVIIDEESHHHSLLLESLGSTVVIGGSARPLLRSLITHCTSPNRSFPRAPCYLYHSNFSTEQLLSSADSNVYEYLRNLGDRVGLQRNI